MTINWQVTVQYFINSFFTSNLDILKFMFFGKLKNGKKRKKYFDDVFVFGKDIDNLNISNFLR